MVLEHHHPTMSTLWGHGGRSKIKNKNMDHYHTQYSFQVQYIKIGSRFIPVIRLFLPGYKLEGAIVHIQDEE